MAWRRAKVEDQREYLVKSYISRTGSMKQLCEELGVSRKTGYKWYQRYLEGGKDALSDQSRAPKEPCRKFSITDMQVALELKQQYPRYGPKKILALLKRRYPDRPWPCATRLYELFKEHHLVCSRKLRRRVPRTHPLSHANESNDVWCADFKGWFLTEDQSKVEPLTITDAYSRYVIKCQHLERKTFEEVWLAYTKSFEQYGLPKRIRTDNGPPFASTGVGRLSKLAINLVKSGVVPEWIAPGHPEENGRHERFHKSLKDAVVDPPARCFSEQIMWMDAYTEEFNFERPHEALNQQVPGSVYEPSSRIWDGQLRAPEYDTHQVSVRKVCQNGCIHWHQMGCYLGQVLSGEYVGIQPVDTGLYHIFYGPIYLGLLREGIGFERPELPRRR